MQLAKYKAIYSSFKFKICLFTPICFFLSVVYFIQLVIEMPIVT